MSAQVIRRPVWRSFPETALSVAAAFARAGGHAVVRVPGRTQSAWLLMPCTDNGLPPLSEWALFMLGRRTYGEVCDEPAKGLAMIRIARRFEPRVTEWCARDVRWPGATRAVTLDCTACGACCHGCRPVLERSDLAAWRKAGRIELAGHTYTKRSRGHLIIRLRPHDASCVHLDNRRCRIYDVRPYPCRVFPVGNESCLAARTTAFGIVDGAGAES